MKLITLSIVILTLFSCNKEDQYQEIEENQHFINNSEINPFIKKRNINGFDIQVTYSPRPENNISYLDHNEEQSLHFILEIESDGKKRNGNFLYKDVNSIGDFKSNVNYFNFSIIEDVHIAVNDTPFNVVLSNMENTYTLDERRKIHFIAVPPSSNYQNKTGEAKQISFVYDDYLLGVGRTKFIFNTPKIKPIPNKL